MLCKPKISKLRKRFYSFLVLFFVLFIAFFCLFEFKARHLVQNSVDNELEILAQNSMDEAVCEVLEKMEGDFSDFIIANTGDNSNVTSVLTDSKEINILKSRLSKAITEKIKEEKKVTVSVPMGAFTGLVLLSDIGPDLPIKLTMGGSCTTDIKSEFKSAGINQTVHHIYMSVEADVSLTCPIISYETTLISQYELCQTVIVGSTPNLFANVAN